MMEMQERVEKETLDLAGKLISECHKHTSDASVGIAALRVSLETIASGARVSGGVQSESNSIPSPV